MLPCFLYIRAGNNYLLMVLTPRGFSLGRGIEMVSEDSNKTGLDDFIVKPQCLILRNVKWESAPFHIKGGSLWFS